MDLPSRQMRYAGPARTINPRNSSQSFSCQSEELNPRSGSFDFKQTCDHLPIYCSMRSRFQNRLKLISGLSEFRVLHLQFDLVHLQFVVELQRLIL